MGNTSSYELIPENYKMATQVECAMQPYARRFEGCGNTSGEALERLKEVCETYNIPVPKPVPNHKNSYYCGTVTVNFLLKSKKRFNTVWFTNINDKYTAHIFYSSI